MANINVGLQDEQDPNYTHAARDYTLIDKGAIERNKNKELQFNSLIELISTGVKGVDTAIKEGIKSDIYEGVDKIRGAQGVDVAAATPTVENEPLSENKPADVEIIRDGISRVHNAYNQGKISDTNYYAQLESMVRSVRSRYPGYRDEIDSMVHSVTGITPANALRKSLLSDLESSQSSKDKESRDFEKFVTSNIDVIPADYWDRKSNGSPYSEQEIYQIVNNNRAKEYQVKRQAADLDLKVSQGKATEADSESFAKNYLSTLNNKVIEQVTPFFNKLIKDQEKGVDYSPKEKDWIRSEFTKLKASTLLTLNENFSKELSPGSGKTLNGLIDSNKKKMMIDDSMQIFEVLDKAISSNDYGVLNTALNHTKAMNESDHKNILEKYPTIRTMDAIGNTKGGAEVLKQLITIPDTGIQSRLTGEMQALMGSLAVTNATGGRYTPTGNTTVDDQMKDILNLPNGNKPEVMKSYINNWTSLLSNPALPQENKALAAGVFFNKNNLNFLSKFKAGRGDDSRFSVFNQLTSPSITREMVKLKETNPQVWQDYSFWTKNAFTDVYRSAMVDINDTPNRPWVQVTFNEKSNQFEVSPTPEGIKEANLHSKNSIGFSAMQTIERLQGENISKAVDTLNAGLRNIKPVLDAEGSNTSEEVRKLTGYLSLTDKKNPTTWQWLLKGMSPKGKGDKGASLEDSSTFGGVHPNFTQASGDENSRSLLSLNKDPNEAIAAIKGAFSKGESGDNYNRLVSGTGTPNEAPLTNMTISEVLAYQGGMIKAGHLSTASGKYQVIKGTLKSLVDEGVVKLTDKFSAETQERIADALLERRGLSKFLEGRMGWRDFVHNLGDEWEILKKSPTAVKNLLGALQMAKEDRLASK